MTCHSKNSAVPQERCSSVEWWLRERVALPVWRRVDVVEVGGVGESDGDAGRSLSPPSCGRHRGGGCEEMCTDDPCADRQEICPDEASSTTPYTIPSSYLHPAAFCHLRPLLLHHSISSKIPFLPLTTLASFKRCFSGLTLNWISCFNLASQMF